MTFLQTQDPQDAADQMVLIVDDNESERFRLVLLMERLGLCPIFASDGVEGLQMADRYKPQIIISDWYMPGMDGLQLCKQLRKTDYGSRVYFILVTGEDRDKHLALGLSEGADDFVTKPYQADEIRARVTAGRRALLNRRQLETSNANLQKKLSQREQAQIRIKENLASAAKLQTRLLPPKNSVLGGMRIAHIAESPDDLAGDVFGCRPLGTKGDIGFFHVDVVGHGVSAALNSFSVARLLSSTSAAKELLTQDGRITPPDRVMTSLNEYFNSDEECDQYFTMVYGVINTSTGEGSLCQAGHPHPLIIRPDGRSERLGTGGLPVGLMEFARFENIDFKLNPGDRLLLYSDGTVEAESPDGEQLGFLSFSRKAASTRELPLQEWVDQLGSHVLKWVGNRQLEDDMSMLALERIDQAMRPSGKIE